MQNIKEIRIAKGLTQEFVAKQAKISQQKYSRIEKNPKRCPVLLACKIADVLGCDVRFFLT